MVLEPFLICVCHLFFIYLRVVDKSNWTGSRLWRWRMLKIATIHLLLFCKFESVRRYSFRHHIVLHNEWHTVFQFIIMAWHSFEYLFCIDDISHDVMVLILNERRHGDLLLMTGPLMLAHCMNGQTIHLSLIVILLWSWLDLSMINHHAILWWRNSIILAPIEAINHQRHISSPILLLWRWR